MHTYTPHMGFNPKLFIPLLIHGLFQLLYIIYSTYIYVMEMYSQLNEVKAGGRTVFPRVGAGVKPVEGSAVFWYNLHESGDPDKLTLHGACPVLYGTKWGKYISHF